MADLNTKVVVGLVDRLSVGMRRISANIKRSMDIVKTSAVGAAVRFKKAFDEGAFNRVGKNIGNVTRQTRRLALQLTGIVFGAGFLFKKAFLDIAAAFEKYQIQLTQLLGSNDAARNAMKWVEDFTNRTPFQLDGVMQAFVRLRTFGIDPMDGSLQAIADQTAKLAGGQVELEGIILALGQAWTKQKLQGEEALQLIERGVPVWDLLAKATSLTVQRLQELSVKGQLGRKAIKLLIDEMGRQSTGSALANMQAWEGMISNISDQWTRFANRVMAAGVFDFLKEKLSTFLDRVNALADNGKLNDIAKQVADNLLVAFRELWKLLVDLVEIIKTIVSWAQRLRDLFGSWKPIILGIVAVIAGPLIAAIWGLLSALVGLALALGATPFGLFVAGAVIVAGIAGMLLGVWNPIKKYWPKTWDFLVDTVGSAIAKIIDFVKFVGPAILTPLAPVVALFKGLKKLMQCYINTVKRTTATVKTITEPQYDADGRRIDRRRGIISSDQKGVNIGGELKITVDSEGRVNTKVVNQRGPMDILLDTGLMMATP